MSLGTAVPAPAPRSLAGRIARNSAANVTRLAITSLVSLLLPAYLTHKLPVEIYGAWVLILQLGAYVGYLDLGVQTAVSKYIAEYEAKGDLAGCGRCASAGLAIMIAACIAGIVLTFSLAFAVPELFRQMPLEMYREVRISIVLVGVSLSLNLIASIYSAIFLGLQRYQVPMVTTAAGRLLYGAAIVSTVYLHCSLPQMAAAVAAANIISGILQVVAWNRFASHIRVSLSSLDRPMLKQMFGYCFVLTIWSACMLVISGVDLTIVGHYDLGQVAYYSIATSPTSFVLMLFGAILSPLLPASSALSAERSPGQMQELLVRATRYGTILLLACGLPLMVAAYPILKLWVGSNYAIHSMQYLRILVLANIIRHLCAPYATMVVATAKQKVATASGVAEAAVNLVASIWLAKHYGAMGVAAGTLIGSVVGISIHFAVSMHFTRNISTSRLTLFLSGILRPMVMALPTLALLGKWNILGAPDFGLPVWILWASSTLLTAWMVSLKRTDREQLLQLAGH